MNNAQKLAALIDQAQTLIPGTTGQGGAAGNVITVRTDTGRKRARCMTTLPPGDCVVMLAQSGWVAMPANATRQVGARQVDFRQSRQTGLRSDNVKVLFRTLDSNQLWLLTKNGLSLIVDATEQGGLATNTAVFFNNLEVHNWALRFNNTGPDVNDWSLHYRLADGSGYYAIANNATQLRTSVQGFSTESTAGDWGFWRERTAPDIETSFIISNQVDSVPGASLSAGHVLPDLYVSSTIVSLNNGWLHRDDFEATLAQAFTISGNIQGNIGDIFLHYGTVTSGAFAENVTSIIEPALSDFTEPADQRAAIDPMHQQWIGDSIYSAAYDPQTGVATIQKTKIALDPFTAESTPQTTLSLPPVDLEARGLMLLQVKYRP